MASASSSISLTGCVKWFDNGLNYGFITVLSEGEHNKTDVFVHQSNIQTKRECFRTLYTGECVQFDFAKSENAKHPYHAVNVSGYNGTMLHCENPNYRPHNNDNGNGRGRGNGSGRGSGRGSGHGRGSGNFQSRMNRDNQHIETTTEGSSSTIPTQSTISTVPVTVPVPVSVPVPIEQVQSTQQEGRGRGRGRGRTQASS